MPLSKGADEPKVRRHVPLSEWTTLGVGGPAGELVEVTDVAELGAALERAGRDQAPVLVLGGGSNVVIADEGFAGLVVRVAIKGRHARLEGDNVLVSVGAGEDWARFVESCVSEGLSGVECLSGIPGLVGGTPVQNVGAYGQEVEATVREVGVWDRLGTCAERLTPRTCRFSYRDSIFKHSARYVVTDVLYSLQRSSLSQPLRYQELAERLGTVLGQRAPLDEAAAAVLALRRAKGMVLDPDDPDTRSAGSFFTNPVLGGEQMARLSRQAPDAPSYPAPGGRKVPAAWLVEHAGFPRGYKKGTAAISSKHALALTSQAGGSAADVVALAREVRDGVMTRFGVLLEPEPVLVGLHL